MRLYIYKTIQDKIAAIETVDQLVQNCEAGVSLEYERNSIGGHLAEQTIGEYGALQTLTQVLGGEYSRRVRDAECGHERHGLAAVGGWHSANIGPGG